MVTYSQNEAGDFVPDDGRSILRRTDQLTIYLTLAGLVRTANGDAGDLDDILRPNGTISRNINAEAELGRNSIHLLHQGQHKPYRGRVRVHIGDATVEPLRADQPGIGWTLTPNLDESSERVERDLTFSVRVPNDQFEWLWQQIGEFRQPILRVSLRLQAWQFDIDRDFGLDAGVCPFTLLASDRKSVWSHYTPIFGAGFHVDDGDGYVKRDGHLWNAPEADAEPVQAVAGPTANPAVVSLLRWIVGLLVVIAGLLAFKLG